MDGDALAGDLRRRWIPIPSKSSITAICYNVKKRDAHAKCLLHDSVNPWTLHEFFIRKVPTMSLACFSNLTSELLLHVMVLRKILYNLH